MKDNQYMTAWSSFGPPRLYVGPDVEESANKISEVHMGFKTGDRYIKDVMGYNGPSGTNRFSLVRVTGIEKDSDAFVLGYAESLRRRDGKVRRRPPWYDRPHERADRCRMNHSVADLARLFSFPTVSPGS